MKKVTKSEFHQFYGDDPNAILKVVADQGWPYALQIVSKRSGTVIAKKVPTQKEWPHQYEYYINENYRR